MAREQENAIPTKPGFSQPIQRIVFSYLLFASLWILVSDQLLERLARSPEELARWSLLKGWGFVLVTALLLALLLHREFRRRAQTEAALRESEARWRGVLREVPFPMLIHAEDGRVIEVNRAWTEISGYAREDIPTIADWTLRAYGERRAKVQADIERLYALETRRYEGEYVIKTRTGELRTWDFSSAPLGRMSDGRRLVVSMAMDITERQRAELERHRFVLLAESSSEFIGMCDLDLQPIYVNPAGIRMVGLPDMAAACRMKVQDYFFPEDQAFIAKEFFPRVMREGHGDVEIRLRHFQTGEPIWCSTTSSAFATPTARRWAGPRSAATSVNGKRRRQR